MKILTGKWSRGELDRLIRESTGTVPGERIALLSLQFLGVPYKESTLVGDALLSERLVVDLSGVDCFTFLDYVEAMRLSGSFDEFLDKLPKVRYRSGTVSFRDRNHFFTDWAVFNASFVTDVTEELGGVRTVKVTKLLNRRSDGTLFIGGIEPVRRLIRYIPTEEYDSSCRGRLRTGDYAGIYTPAEGLDVSHVGIIIRKDGALCLRHASSTEKNRMVVDEDLGEYLAGKPGIIVLRAK